METNNNTQNDNMNESRPVRAPGFANGSTNGGDAADVVTPVNGGNDVVLQDKPKKNHGMLYGMILLAILAAGGIGFGVWAMMDGNSRSQKKDEQISQLQSQLVEKSEVVVEDDTAVVESNTDDSGKTGVVNYGFQQSNAPGLQNGNASVASVAYIGIRYDLSLEGTVEASFQWVNSSISGPNAPEKKNLTDKIPGRAIDIATGVTGNGGLGVVLFLLQDGTVAYANEDGVLSGDYEIRLVKNATDVVAIYGNLQNIDCAGYIQDRSGTIRAITVDEVEVNGASLKVE